MKIDGKKILKDLKKGRERKPVTLYLSQDLYLDFKKACGKASSKVIEKLMKEFLESLSSKSG